MDQESVKPDLDMWAYVELFGHTSFAGRVTSKPVGSFSFIQIDIADGKGGVAFSRLVGPSAIYSITPTTQEIAQEHMAARGAMTNCIPYTRPMLPEPVGGDGEDDSAY